VGRGCGWGWGWGWWVQDGAEVRGRAPTFWICRANQNEITDKRTCQSDPSPRVKAAALVEAHFGAVRDLNEPQKIIWQTKTERKYRSFKALGRA